MTQPITVREARERRTPPMTQEQLADKSGVDQTYISLIERLLRCPSDEIKSRIAKALRIAPSKLHFAAAPADTSVDASYDRAGQGGRPTPPASKGARATAAGPVSRPSGLQEGGH